MHCLADLSNLVVAEAGWTKNVGMYAVLGGLPVCQLVQGLENSLAW